MLLNSTTTNYQRCIHIAKYLETQSITMIGTFISCVLILCSLKTGTTTTEAVYKINAGSVFVVKPSSKYKINNGIIKQMSQFFEKCEDSLIKYTWNGSDFLIGPVLTNYVGRYVMSLQNNSNMWENRTFVILVIHAMPRVQSDKVIVDEGDSINLTCTYHSNCKGLAMWTKDELNGLPTDEEKNLGNNTKSLTYIVKNAETHFGNKPYYCKIQLPEIAIAVQLVVKESRTPDVAFEPANKSSFWFEENKDAAIPFRIMGSPLPNLTCSDKKTEEEILYCSKNKMKDILYNAINKPCKSRNERYILSSKTKQTDEVTLVISKIKLEMDNGALSCVLMNSKGEQKDFSIGINVKALSVTVRREPNSSSINCVVRGNPPPEITWKKCSISNNTSCEPAIVNKAKKEVRNESHRFLSSMLLNTSHSHIIKCIASNSLGSKEGSYVYQFKGDEIHSEGGDKEEDNTLIFITIGCGLFLLLVVVISLVLYVKERKRNSIYRQFFLANTNYTIDPLKTLNEQMHNLSYDEDWEFPYMHLEFKELIGCGAFGKVFKAKAYGIGLMNSRDKGTQARKQRKQLNKVRHKKKLAHYGENECMTVAVKTTKDNPNVDDIRDLAGELKMIIHVGQHENIVNVLGACTKYPKLYMIIEYCSHGSLLEFLRKRREIFQPSWFEENFASKERFTIVNLVLTAIQVCNGMRFLASKKCIHRDLAARNVLVADNYVMKVADFGMAREVVDNDNYISNTQGYLPVKWMALESILEKVYTEESDAWSFGILLWEMFTLGQTPYPSIPVQQLVALLSNSVRMKKPFYCPAEIYVIMLECWNENPKERPSFEVLYAKFQKLLQMNVIEDSAINSPNHNDGVFCKETEIL